MSMLAGLDDGSFFCKVAMRSKFNPSALLQQGGWPPCCSVHVSDDGDEVGVNQGRALGEWMGARENQKKL